MAVVTVFVDSFGALGGVRLVWAEDVNGEIDFAVFLLWVVKGGC